VAKADQRNNLYGKQSAIANGFIASTQSATSQHVSQACT